MQIVLPSSCSRILLKTICLCATLAYVGTAARDYLAYWLASSEQRDRLEKAIALDPTNAEYRHRLGYYFMFVERRSDMAVPMYKSAVTLNPHIAEYWLDLASAYAAVGAPEQQEQALNRAVEVEPRTPLILQQAATAFVVRGELKKAFKLFRSALEGDPSEDEPTITLCWQAAHNVDAMKDVLPRTPQAYFVFLSLLISEQNDIAAQKTWSDLISLSQRFPLQLARPYLDYLVMQRQFEAVRAAWVDLAKVDVDFRRYLPSAENLIVNGSFEEPLLNMGFDWRYADRSDAKFALDGEQARQGSRSLLVSFDGEALVDIGVSQLIALDANTRYSFRAYVKSDNIFAAHGPRFVISTVDTRSSLLLTDELLGTSAWKQVGGTFATDPTTRMVLLKVMRAPGAGRITGRFWIDAVSLVRE